MYAPIEANVEQIKTACGFVPVSSVEMGPIRLKNGGNGPSVFTFTLKKPDEGGSLSPGYPGSSLLSLAACVTRAGGSIRVESKKMLALASRLGPLFGASDIEPVEDWAAACAVADLSVSLQQIVNGARGLPLLTSLFNLEKRHSTNLRNGDQFDFFYIVRDVRASYLDRFGGRRVESQNDPCTWSTVFVRRVQEGAKHIYVFLILSAEAGEAVGQLELAAISLDHVMTRREYEAVRLLLVSRQSVDDEDSSVLLASSPLDQDVWLDVNGGSDDCSDDDDDFSSIDFGGGEAEVTEQDMPVLGAMVQALVSAHLAKDAHVDPFQTDELTGYITFDTLLSWIWFDFSKCLGAAKIGYCVECGTPFSLVGHRGIPREFCSQACKTKAKNRRMRELRENVRHDFLTGSNLSEIAAFRMKDEAPDRAVIRAREMLQNWPELKHLVEAEVCEQGLRSTLLRRCFEAGLIPKILSRKAREILSEAAHGPEFGI